MEWRLSVFLCHNPEQAFVTLSRGHAQKSGRYGLSNLNSNLTTIGEAQVIGKILAISERSR